MQGATMGLSMSVIYYICGLKETITDFLVDFNTAPILGWKKYMALFHALYCLAYFYTK